MGAQRYIKSPWIKDNILSLSKLIRFYIFIVNMYSVIVNRITYFISKPILSLRFLLYLHI